MDVPRQDGQKDVVWMVSVHYLSSGMGAALLHHLDGIQIGLDLDLN